MSNDLDVAQMTYSSEPSPVACWWQVANGYRRRPTRKAPCYCSVPRHGYDRANDLPLRHASGRLQVWFGLPRATLRPRDYVTKAPLLPYHPDEILQRWRESWLTHVFRCVVLGRLFGDRAYGGGTGF